MPDMALFAAGATRASAAVTMLSSRPASPSRLPRRTISHTVNGKDKVEAALDHGAQTRILALR